MASYYNRKVGRMKLEQGYGQLHAPFFKLKATTKTEGENVWEWDSE